jgi:RhoGEF domain/SOS1/NGEF-like PH domain
LKRIFYNIELIQNVNAGLLSKLTLCWDEQKDLDGSQITGLGEIFLEIADNLRVYSQYCNNHASAVEALMRCRAKHSKFAAFLDAIVIEERPVDLRDYLIKPAQRICKYPLLIREVLKHTPDDHVDAVPLRSTQDKLQAVTRQINQTKRQFENREKIESIARSLEGLKGQKLQQPGRVFYREGVLQKVNPKGKVQSRHFYLFSDILIWAKKQAVGNKASFKGVLYLDLAVVRECQDKRGAHAFQIVRMDTKKIYTLLAESDELKRAWMKDVGRIVNRYLGVSNDDDEDDPFFVESSASLSSAADDNGSAAAAAASSGTGDGSLRRGGTFSNSSSSLHGMLAAAASSNDSLGGSGSFMASASSSGDIGSLMASSPSPALNAAERELGNAQTASHALASPDNFVNYVNQLLQLLEDERAKRLALERLASTLEQRVKQLEDQQANPK